MSAPAWLEIAKAAARDPYNLDGHQDLARLTLMEQMGEALRAIRRQVTGAYFDTMSGSSAGGQLEAALAAYERGPQP